MLRRPKGYSGLEIPFHIILNFMEAENGKKSQTQDDRPSFNLAHHRIELVRKTCGVFLWHIL